MAESEDGRGELLQFLRNELIGPAGGADEELREIPNRRYLMATLYPRNAKSDETVQIEVEDGVLGSYGEEVADDPVSFAHEWMPASVGLSFYTRATSIEVALWAAAYDQTSDRPKRWTRRALAVIADPPTSLTGPSGGGRHDVPVLEGRATLGSNWRPFAEGHLVTVTLVNNQEQDDTTRIDPVRCLYQVGFECRASTEPILEYPALDSLSRDREDEELRLVHRKARVFAIGHGCAVQWDATDEPSTARVRVDFMPEYELAPLKQLQAKAPVFALARLAKGVDTEVLEGLSEMAADYRTWIEELPALNADIPPRLSAAKDRILDRLHSVAKQIESCIDLLKSEPLAREAFALANKAMLMQMRHAEADRGGQPRDRDSIDLPPIEYMELTQYRWRPFQLAFILLVLESAFNPASEDRETVDLLWFPTGGGKTEAYLAVAAFVIFLRRLRDADKGVGTAVITRYTLRLLTTQQFQRAAAMIAACELIRRGDTKELGSSPMSIGLWVGDEVTPNQFSGAVERYEEMREQDPPRNRFQLETCMWCGTRIVPLRREEDDVAYGVTAANSSFLFRCPSLACPFHERLPVQVVDEALYDDPPTLLIATVDKFARLAWEERGGAFFGGGDRLPPSLIIQDELHLLSGPLGTTVGLYEAAIEALIALKGAHPKILASTATIRHADEQVTGLYGRPVRIFPPSGLDANDSYFAEVDRAARGRLYVGVMAPSHTMSTTIVNVGAALLEGPKALELSTGELDAYWTLVLYHNSIRELGRSVTLARDDIPARIRAMTKDEAKMRVLRDDSVVELTSNVQGADLPDILSRMKVGPDDSKEISILATTNMLSVGVDVPRLGLMMLVGQPKTTSEYIQASSRVGRGASPGLVLPLYSATKPRDRSHYERFRPFHSAVYRYVEPTSVTPFSPQSRDRALHAAMVILVRHGAGLAANSAAMNFDPRDPQVEAAMARLLAVVKRVDQREAEATERHLDELVQQWVEQIDAAKEERKILHYQIRGKGRHSLLRDFGTSGSGWRTLQSMRNVDRQAHIVVQGEVPRG